MMKKTLKFTHPWKYLFKAFYLPFLYFQSFNKNTNISTLHSLNKTKNVVILYFRGLKRCAPFHIKEIIYDLQIISSLSSEDAAAIGYYYGANYHKFSQSAGQNFNYSINNFKKKRYTILSIDRRNNILFSFKSKNRIQKLTFSPSQLLKEKKLLEGFHPIQSCYIGILAGLNSQRLKNMK